MREGYKKTEVGIIPEDWEVQKLGNIVNIKSGSSPSKFNLNERGEYPFFKVDDMNYGFKYLNNSKLYFNSNDINLMKSGMVLFPKRGASIFTNKILILNKDGYFDTNLMGLVCKRCINNEFLYYFLYNYELSKIADTSSIPQINNKHIEPLKIQLPPLKEQEKIAEILSTVDSQIDDTEKLIEKSKELKKGLMQKLLTKGIGHREFKKTEVGEIPIEWKVENNFIKIFSGFGFKLKEYSKKGLPLIRINNVTHGKILDEEWVYVPNSYAEKYSEFVVKKGDILLSLNRPITQGKLKICMVDMEQAMLYQRVGKLVMDNEIYYPKFYYYYMQSRIFMKKLECGLVGTDQPYIKNSEFKDIKFPVPSIEEQKSIVKIFTSLDDQICEYENEKQKLCEVKKALIQQLLMGKIRVI